MESERGGSLPGTPVAVYRDRSSKEIRDIGAVVFNAKGNASAPKRVHADNWTMPGCPVNGPALAARGERFLVAWPTMAAGPMAVRAALGDGSRFDAPARPSDREAAVAGQKASNTLRNIEFIAWLASWRSCLSFPRTSPQFPHPL